MATALSATFQAGTGSAPARVLLSVTGAPTLTANYTSNFSTTDDGWTGSAGTFLLNASEGGPTSPVDGMELQGAAAVTSTFYKTVTGLTVGQTYRFSVAVDIVRGTVALGVTGKTAGAFTYPNGRQFISYSFAATATSHVIEVKVKPGKYDDNGVAWIDTVTVIKSSAWLGTTITRTDANGTAVVVRESTGGQDATGTSGSGTMTVYDYEAALNGTVSYTVTDGVGDTATANVAQQTSPGVWVTLPATTSDLASSSTPPDFVGVEMVTGLGERREFNGTIHEIIGRADPIVNPGPLMLRSGTVDVWCSTYAVAQALTALLENGDVALLRQPTFPGLDVYFIATGTDTRPEQATTPTRRWIVTITYREVVAP